MIKIIKRGGFREQTARQLKYQDSVNQRSNLNKQIVDQTVQNSTPVEQTNQNESDAAKTEQIDALNNSKD